MTAEGTDVTEGTVAEVDAAKCCGYGNCVLVAPELFDLSPQTNLAYLVDPAPVDEQRDLLQSAARQCPTEAIRVLG